MENYELIIVKLLAKLLANEGSDTVQKLQFEALIQLRAYLQHYHRLNYRGDLLSAIAEKKGTMILQTTSKTEMEKVLKPHAPRYNGNGFFTDKYNVPEEELICWSETSLRSPLNEAGFNRYMEVCKLVYPDAFADVVGLKGA